MSDAHETTGKPTLEKTQQVTAPGGALEQSESAAAYGPGQGAATGPDDDGDGGGRFWSPRRRVAGLVALVLLGGAGVLLYDVASVRAGRPGMSWRRTLADELATNRLDSAPVLAGAAVAALLGLWLIVLALTPGLRGLLPMRRDAPQVRAGLERAAAALVLRDRAMEVPGVRSVRVEVKRRTVRARALAHFRELDEVRGDLDTALEDGIRQLGLARQLGLTVHVRRPVKR